MPDILKVQDSYDRTYTVPINYRNSIINYNNLLTVKTAFKCFHL